MNSHQRLVTLSLLGASTLALFGCSGTEKNQLQIASGETVQITEATNLSKLSIAVGGGLGAPEGYDLSLTVNGVETAIAPGEYTGDLMLEPTEEIISVFDGMGTKATYRYRAAVVVDDNQLMQGKSVSSASKGGTVTGQSAAGIDIESANKEFMGLLISDSEYDIEDANINFVGNGGNDFHGFGAALRVGGDSKVSMVNSRISTRGAVRPAVWVGDDAKVVVENAHIEVSEGTLPDDYGWSWTDPSARTPGAVMMEVPWMLGLRGNNRATLVVGNAEAHYNNSYIKAEAWGALSTDAVGEAELYANGSVIEVEKSGYGGYADGNSLVAISDTKVNVPDYGMIMSGGSVTISDQSVINSGRLGIMSHGGEKGVLTIDSGSVVNAAKAVIQLKSSSPTIRVADAELNSESGLILQVMPGDDPFKPFMAAQMAQMMGGGNGPGGPGGAGNGAAPGGPPPGGQSPEGGAPDAAAQLLMRDAGKYSVVDGDSHVDASFKNVNLKGDFLNSATEDGGMRLVFENTQVHGAISTAIGEHAVGHNGEPLLMRESGELYYLIGQQTETLAPIDVAYGADASFDSKSSWMVSRTSYLTGLMLAEGASVSAPEGHRLTILVNGEEASLAAGRYEGAIELRVTALSPGAPGRPPVVQNSIDLDQTPFFEEVDANDDGFVTQDEWSAAGMPSAMFSMFSPDKPGNATLADFEARDPMESLDTNNDGKISLNEVLAPMADGPPDSLGNTGGRPPGPPPGEIAPR